MVTEFIVVVSAQQVCRPTETGKGPDSSYMRDILEAKNKHLFVKKSDAEIEYYYMGQFDVMTVEKGQK